MLFLFCLVLAVDQYLGKVKLMKKVIYAIVLVMLTITANAQINSQNVIFNGRSQLYFGNYLNAIEQFNIVIKIEPHLPEPYFYRGVSKMYLEDYRGALADLSKAVDIKPFYPDAYINRGLVNYYLRNFEAAMNDYSKALELDNDNPDIYNNRGICKAEMGDYKGAIEDYTHSIELKPKNYRAYLNRSIAYSSDGDVKNAIRDCNSMIRLRPNSPTGYMSRGILKMNQDDYAGALRDFDMAIYVEPINAFAYQYRGLVKQRLNSFEAAIDDYNMAIQYDPTMASAYFNRGIVRELLERDGYMDDYNMASVLDARYQKRPWKTKEERDEAQQQQMQAWQKQVQKQVQKTGTSNINKVATIDENDATADNTEESQGEIDYEDLRKRKVKADLIVAETNSSDSESRARIQNRYVEIELLPNFSIFNLNNPQKVGTNVGYFNMVVENLNSKNNYDPYLIISSQLPAGNYNESFFKNQILRIQERIRQNPGISNNYIYLGVFNLLLEDFNEALNNFNQSIKLDDRNLLAYFLRANTRLQMIEKIEAITNKSGGQIIKNNASILMNSSQTEVTFDGYDDILTDLQVVLYMNPDFYFGYYNRGNLYCKVDKYALAIDEYSQAINLNPEFAEAYYNRGLVKVLLNDIDGGARDLSRAGELGISEAYNVIKRYCN